MTPLELLMVAVGVLGLIVGLGVVGLLVGVLIRVFDGACTPEEPEAWRDPEGNFWDGVAAVVAEMALDRIQARRVDRTALESVRPLPAGRGLLRT